MPGRSATITTECEDSLLTTVGNITTAYHQVNPKVATGGNTIKVGDDADSIIESGRNGTGLTKRQVVEKAVRYWVPRVLRGEISVIDLPEATAAGAHDQAAGGAR